MNNKINPTPYLPPELEVIAFDCNDIITTSYTPDNKEDGEW